MTAGKRVLGMLKVTLSSLHCIYVGIDENQNSLCPLEHTCLWLPNNTLLCKHQAIYTATRTVFPVVWKPSFDTYTCTTWTLVSTQHQVDIGCELQSKYSKDKHTCLWTTQFTPAMRENMLTIPIRLITRIGLVTLITLITLIALITHITRIASINLTTKATTPVWRIRRPSATRNKMLIYGLRSGYQ